MRAGHTITPLLRLFACVLGCIALHPPGASAASSSATYDGVVTGTSGVQSYWKLDETSGTTAADAIGSATGTYASTTGIGTTGVSGITGSKGVTVKTTYVNAGDVYPFSGLATYSVEAWVKLNAVPTTAEFIVDRETSTGNRDGWTFGIGNGGIVLCERFTANAQTGSLATTATLRAGAWYHILCTFDGSKTRAYINGQLVTTGPTASALGNSAGSPLLIGSWHSSAPAPRSTFDGVIDNVAVYNRALTTGEADVHYLTGQDYYSTRSRISSAISGAWFSGSQWSPSTSTNW